ncbi:DUF2332 domain-containing protein [Natronobacterium texcoconense]|uniref:DUF2332 domain-containing protein n=1 Tax=Natronobacterium texcoconense TaxID=1095778 RepID=UPI000B847791|nr:DUF2332 domain-containing protein [Natronobacterium texcoconense]
MDISDTFLRYAGWVEDKCPLYATVAEATATDDHLLDIASEASVSQPEPELLLAAVHSLLLQGRDHPLAQFYPTCNRNGPDEDPVPHFRDFCVTNEDTLRSIIATRRCQTNDVGRSAILLPAFEHVSRIAEHNLLAQIEIGTSAGLNLNWDQYQYEFDAIGEIGKSDSPVTITTEVRGDHRPPFSQDLPTITHLRGIDLHTLDVTTEQDARWLHALIHPNQLRRHQQLTGAIDIAREKQPSLVEGDAVAELPTQLLAAPNKADLIVFSTHVLYQLEESTIADLRSLLSDHSTEQPVHWLSIDPDEGLGRPTYRLVTFKEGDVTESQIAQFESYGNWIRWQGA